MEMPKSEDPMKPDEAELEKEHFKRIVNSFRYYR